MQTDGHIYGEEDVGVNSGCRSERSKIFEGKGVYVSYHVIKGTILKRARAVDMKV